MTKTTVFTLQEYDITAKKAGGNVTRHYLDLPYFTQVPNFISICLRD